MTCGRPPLLVSPGAYELAHPHQRSDLQLLPPRRTWVLVTFRPSRTGAVSFRASDGRATPATSGRSSATGLPGAASAISGGTSF